MSTSLPYVELKALSCVFSTAPGFAFSIPWAFGDMEIRQMEKKEEKQYEIQHYSVATSAVETFFSGQGLCSGLVD